MGIKRTVLIRQIDLWTGKTFSKKRNKNKMQKTKIRTFPFVFLANSFVFKKMQIRKGRRHFRKKFKRQNVLKIDFLHKKTLVLDMILHFSIF